MNECYERAPKLALAAMVGMLFIVTSSQAHQQWLAPNFFAQSGESAWLSFDHTFGDRRFLPSSGPGSYYSWWIVGSDGLRRSWPHLFMGKTRTVGEIELTQGGTYRLEALEDELPWTQIKIDGKDHWQPGTRRDFKGSEITRSRIYFNKVVSYVTLGSMTRTVLSSTGDPLEIVFEDHPNDLREGNEIRVRVLTSGEPLDNQTVRMFSEQTEGHDASETCNTDKKGYCELKAASAGRFLLTTNTEGDNPKGSSTDDFHHGYSVLIEVKAADKTESE